MSLHAISTLRQRSRQRVGAFTLALSVMLTLWLAVSGQVALAQPAPPPPPNANARTATTNEDTPVTINTGIQVDPRYQVNIVVPGPSHGTIVTGGAHPGNFTITYTPGANQTSAVSFSYQLCTVAGTPPICGQSALVSVTITAVNDGPQAGADTASLQYGKNTLINVLFNDNGGANEFDSVSLVAGSVSTPVPSAHGAGTAVIEGNQIRYTAPAVPAACINSTATFTYLVQDSSGLQAAGTVVVTRTCPGTPTIKLGNPYDFTNHTFKVDVILDSPDVDVSALDFVVDYDACLTDVDSPTNNSVADDVTTTLPAGSFLFQVLDTAPPAGGALRIVAASITGPASVMAGPSASATRTIATLQFKALSTCTTVFAAGAAGFTGPSGTAITGDASGLNKNINLRNSVNQKPTNISLSNNKVAEGSPMGTFIGKFTTTDPDPSDTTFTYSLLNNAGGKFQLNPAAINNDELASLTLTGVAPGTYTITVETRDAYNGIYTKTFPIEVTDVNLGAPVADDDSLYQIRARTEITFRSSPLLATDLVFGDTDTADSDPNCIKCSIQAVTNGAKGTVTNLGSKVVYVPTDAKFTGTDVFTYTLTDNDPAGALTDKAIVTVNVAPDAALGDCNKSGGLEAGDLTATGLEIFDGDGNLWYDIYKGTRTAFSPYGCNSNQDNVLDAGDISCTARKIFNANATCGAVVAASASKATLEVASGLRGAAGSTVSVPVSLRNNGNAVDTAVFALAYDASKLSFNADDASAVSLSDGQLAMVNAVDGRVEIVVTGLSAADGAVANINLSVKENASGDAAISLADSSLGSEGGTVAVDIADGAIQIGDAGSTNFRSLLPIIRK
jgi:hypothetical protein